MSLVIETFTKADGAGWGADLTWDTTITGSPRTFNNQASCGGSLYTIANLATSTTSGNNEARVVAVKMGLDGNSVIGIRLRGGPTDGEAIEFVRVGAQSLGAFSVVLRYRSNVGAYTTLAGPLVVPRAGTNIPEQLYFTAIGSTFTCYLNGVQVLAATNTQLFLTRARGGLIIRPDVADGTLADDFRLGDIGATLSPVTFAAKIGTASGAKALLGETKRLLGKGATASNSKSAAFTRIARVRGFLGIVTKAKATSFTTLVEAFNVFRPLLAKVKTSSSTKADLGTDKKDLATKVSSAFAPGIFYRADLIVKHSGAVAPLNLASNVKADLSRGVGVATSAFSAAGATASVGGAHNFFIATAATVDYVSVTEIRGRNFFTGTAADAVSIFADFIYAAPTFYLHCPVVFDTPAVSEHDRTTAKRLFRYYRNRPSGENVFVYDNGEITTIEPDGYTRIWREADRTQDTSPTAAILVRVFWGGHDSEKVTDTEAAALVASGFDVRPYA